MIPLYVVIGLLGFVAFLIALSYNHLVRLRNKVEEAWRDVDVQLERRHDLIPRLVEIVRGYAAHEQALFEEVARLRAEARAAGGAAAKSDPERALAAGLDRLIAVAESNPRLRAADNFLSLQRQINATENEIAAARSIYNGNVRIYNNRLQIFPVSAYADVLGFEPAEFFQADGGDRERVALAY